MVAQRQKAAYDKHSNPTCFIEGTFVWRFYPPTAKQELGKPWAKVVGYPTTIHCDLAKCPGDNPIRNHVDCLKPHWGKIPPAWRDHVESGSEKLSPSQGRGTGCETGSTEDDTHSVTRYHLNHYEASEAAS